MAKPKVATQGKTLNYLGKQPTVSGVPKKWKSSPDHPATELAYITKKEKDVLIDLDLHNSLEGKANKGPGGLSSLNGFAEGADAAGKGGFNKPSGGGFTRPGGGGGGGGGATFQQRYPGRYPGERLNEYRQRMAAQQRNAAIAAERAAAQQAAQQAAEQAAAQQAAQQAAEQAAAQQAAQQAAEQAAAQQAEQQRLVAIEEQRRLDAEQAAKQRAAEEARQQAALEASQSHGTALTALDRPAAGLSRFKGYAPMDYDVSKTGSLTDMYARMLNVPYFQPFMEQTSIPRPDSFIEGTSPDTSIFGIDSLMPTYQFDPTTQTATNPYATAADGGRINKMSGGMMIMGDEGVVNNGIGGILSKYKEIRSEL